MDAKTTNLPKDCQLQAPMPLPLAPPVLPPGAPLLLGGSSAAPPLTALPSGTADGRPWSDKRFCASVHCDRLLRPLECPLHALVQGAGARVSTHEMCEKLGSATPPTIGITSDQSSC